MRTFRYELVERDGSLERGTLAADSLFDARQRIRGRGAVATALNEVPVSTPRAPGKSHLALTLRGLASLIEGGVPLDHALGSGGDDPFLSGIRRRVREGATLAQALSAHRGMPPVVVGLLAAGERARLGPALAAAADHLDAELARTSQLRNALAYPLLLLVVGSGTVAVVLTTVLPRFAALFTDSGQALPASTRLLMTIGGAMNAHPFLVMSALLAASGALVWGSRLRFVDELTLAMPAVGPLRVGLASGRMARTLGTLLGGGASALAALDAAARAAGGAVMSDRVRRAAVRVREGAGLAQALSREGAMDRAALDLVALGEQSGRLADLLVRAGDLSERRAAARLQLLMRFVEPALILVFACAVGFVALAMLQAVYGMRIQ